MDRNRGGRRLSSCPACKKAKKRCQHQIRSTEDQEMPLALATTLPQSFLLLVPQSYQVPHCSKKYFNTNSIVQRLWIAVLSEGRVGWLQATGCRWSTVAIPCTWTIRFQSHARFLFVHRENRGELALLYAGSDIRLQVRLLDFVNFRQGSAGFHY
jgi:hypothetical protein